MKQKKRFYVDPNLKVGDEVLFEDGGTLAVCTVVEKEKTRHWLSHGLVPTRIDYYDGKRFILLGSRFTIKVSRRWAKKSKFGLRIA